MIISHKHRFIFIKTQKTAGTSIEVDLNPLLGESDIATPISPAVEGHAPKNCEGGRLKTGFFNHIAARKVKALIGDKIFDDYFVFCVEREPVDKCISHFSMKKSSPRHNKNTKDLSFDEYIAAKRFPIDTGKYTDSEGNLLVDKILKYEYLADELHAVGKLLGFNINLKARAKVGFRENIVVSESHKERIYEAFAKSLIHTGYTASSCNSVMPGTFRKF